MNATAQFDVLKPVRNKELALDAANVAQCDSEPNAHVVAP